METNIDKGFVKLKRSMLDWEWYQDRNTCSLMIHILLKVNFTTKKWQGNVINPGEFITSIRNLSLELKMTESAVRTSLKKLVKTKYITMQTTNKFTKIKALQSSIYDLTTKVDNKQNDSQLISQSQSNDKPVTTTNKEKKDKEVIERIEIFKKEILKFQNKYSIVILNNFINYWTEENKQTGRLKFEDENYWNSETRLANWKNFPTPKKETNNFHLNR